MNKSIFILALTALSVVHANECDNYSKKYQNDQFWLSVPKNCHLFIVCTPNGDNTHNQVDSSCGDLFWNQELLTCVREIPKFASCDKTATPPTTQATTTFPFECNFVVNPNNKRQYKPMDTDKATYTEYQTCAEKFHFDLKVCTCILDDDVKIECDDKSFLNLKFNGNLDDSSCTNAQAKVVKGGVDFVKSTTGSAAVFNGSGYIDVPAFRNLFAGNFLTELTVSMFFRTDNSDRNELFFDNGEISHDVSVLMGYIASQNVLSAQVKVSGGLVKSRLFEVILPLKKPANTWQHVAYVYKNGYLTITLNGNRSASKRVYEAPNKGKVDYTIDNMDEPLSIGGRSSGNFFFNGMIDEFRVFKRALSANEIHDLAHGTF